MGFKTIIFSFCVGFTFVKSYATNDAASPVHVPLYNGDYRNRSPSDGLCVLPKNPDHGIRLAAVMPIAIPGEKVVSLIVNCNIGYVVLKESTSLCYKGNWSRELPKCVPASPVSVPLDDEDYTSREKQRQCKDGTFISSTFKCDGVIDCPDGRDETKEVCKETTCPPTAFQCTYGGCVEDTAVCNGFSECPDHSDELNCFNTTREMQSPSDAVCVLPQSSDYGRYSVAISPTTKLGESLVFLNLSCDMGYVLLKEYSLYCHNGVWFGEMPVCVPASSNDSAVIDEKLKCSADQWQCNDGTCISSYSTCDIVIDCPDKSDETSAQCSNMTSPSNDVCVLPLNPDHGIYSIAVSPSAKQGQSLLFLNLNCSMDYVLLKEYTLFCHNGVWLGELPACVPASSNVSAVIDEKSTCSEDQWKCKDGTCIDSYSQCDSWFDCPDKSDEIPAECSYMNIPCPPNSFKCTYGACVAKTALCNGVSECIDGSDELQPQCLNTTTEIQPPRNAFCELPRNPDHGRYLASALHNALSGLNFVSLNLNCNMGYVLLKEFTSYCYNGNWLGEKSVCVPASSNVSAVIDEKLTCSEDQRQCKDGTCIDTYSFCDGQIDCRDKSDETSEQCSDTTCPATAFRCNYGGCIERSAACNGVWDCIDGSDEFHPQCSNKTEKIHEYKDRCINGTIIGFHRMCNSKIDCADGSDETLVMCQEMWCPTTAFRCTYGGCVKGTAVCNGVSECLDNSDELQCFNTTREIQQ